MPKFRHQSKRLLSPGRGGAAEGGYILITLMLMIALLAIGMMVATSKAEFQTRRDREEELVHRGVQYARAVRLFFKKTGRYPTRIEELESTNNQRFLRKRYKDPITGEDFKILRMGDVKLTFGQGIAGAQSAAALAAAAQSGGGLTAAGAASRGGGLNPTQSATTDKIVTVTKDSSDENSDAKSNNDSSGEKDSSGTKEDKSGGGSGLTFGGGPIVGVASKSTKESIREFNKKKKYDQWQFIYDPSSDRGGLLNTPAQPPLQGAGGITGAAGQAGASTGINPTGVGPANVPPPPGPQQNPSENPPQN